MHGHMKKKTETYISCQTQIITLHWNYLSCVHIKWQDMGKNT